MIREMHLIAALAVGVMSCSAYGQEVEPNFGVWLQQISRSSAVPPIGRVASKKVNILPGKFDNLNRTDAIFITEEGTKYCKGPHFKKCDSITGMPMKTTVAVAGDKGRDVLFKWDGASSYQLCSLDWSRGNAAVDCRNVSYADVSTKYGRVQANGSILMIDGTDGQYACQAISKEPSCLLVATDKAGTAPEKRQRGENAKFRPDRNTVCHFNGDAFDCRPTLKLSEATETEEVVAKVMQPFMQPAALYFEEDDEPMPQISLEGITIYGQYGGGYNGGYGPFWSDLFAYYITGPAVDTRRFQLCWNACSSGYNGSLTTCLASYPVGFALGAAVCGVGCGDALGSLFVSTCMLGREIELNNCQQACINQIGT